MTELFPGIEPPELQATIDATERALGLVSGMIDRTTPGTQDHRDLLTVEGKLRGAKGRLITIRSRNT